MRVPVFRNNHGAAREKPESGHAQDVTRPSELICSKGSEERGASGQRPTRVQPRGATSFRRVGIAGREDRVGGQADEGHEGQELHNIQDRHDYVSTGPSAVEVGEHRQHPVVMGLRGGRPSLVKMTETCFATALSVIESCCPRALLEWPSAISNGGGQRIDGGANHNRGIRAGSGGHVGASH